MNNVPERKLNLRILTLNCFGLPFLLNTHSRLRTLAAELNESDVDVLLLQEVHLTRYIPLLRRHLPSFPHSAHEPFLYAPKGGLLTLSRRPLENSRFVLYEQRGKWHTPALADWVLHKGVLAVDLNVDGTPVTVLNTHLVANYSADWSPHNRYVQHQRAELVQLAGVVNALDRRCLTLLGGDFNVPRRSWLYQEFVQSTGLLDPLAASDEVTYRPNRLLAARYSQALDHLFVRAPDHARVHVAARIVFKDKTQLTNGRWDYVSDHYGIRAEVEAHLFDERHPFGAPARVRGQVLTLQD